MAKGFLGKKEEKKTFTQNDKHNEPHLTCLSLLPKPTPSPSALLQEMLILAQSISSSAQYVTLKKDFLTSKFSYSLFSNPTLGLQIGRRLLIANHMDESL
jgi:hypothetical protein